MFHQIILSLSLTVALELAVVRTHLLTVGWALPSRLTRGLLHSKRACTAFDGAADEATYPSASSKFALPSVTLFGARIEGHDDAGVRFGPLRMPPDRHCRGLSFR